MFKRSPLHKAAEKGKLEACKLLVEKGASVDARDKDGLTPLHDACTLGKVEVVEYLISQGASVDAVDKVRFFFSLLLFLTSEF